MAAIRLTRRLWREYVHQNALKAAERRLRQKREQLIIEHLGLAETIARNVWRRFTRTGQGGYGSRIELEDMICCARVGLVDAAGRWDPSRGDFAKYCFLRVRGAVIDAYRRQNYTETLHSSIDEWLDDSTNDRSACKMEARFLTDPNPLPDQLVNQQQKAALMGEVVNRLPGDERRVITIALSGQTIEEIGHRCGQSAAWARGKLRDARSKVAAEVQRRAA
jgi:RNA polymerase sigma factor (sigma-70 family)